MGHSIGASGARILVSLLNALKLRKLKYGIATLMYWWMKLPQY